MVTPRQQLMDYGGEHKQPRQQAQQTVRADGYEGEYDKDWAAEMAEWAPGDDEFGGDSGGTSSAAKTAGRGSSQEDGTAVADLSLIPISEPTRPN